MTTIVKVIVILMNAILMIRMNVMMTRTCPFNLKPEYVDEMTVDTTTEIKHKAVCVWRLLGRNCSRELLDQYCSLYGITPEQALQWKDYMLG